MEIRLLLPDVLRPVTRLVKRGTGRWLNFCTGDPTGAKWTTVGRRYRVFFDKTVGAYYSVDLAEWYGRLHYYTGRYYDQLNPALIRQFLGRGDTFVDIGAHYGIHSLAASRVVGDAGRVVSFEPNPASWRLLEGHLALNRARNCTVVRLGLSDSPGELTLSGDDTTKVSFRHQAPVGEAVRVPVATADEVLQQQTLPGRWLVKIDTEGFEHRVIRGMRETLSRNERVALSIEITDEWLRSTGSGAAALYEDLSAMGFQAYLPEWHRGRVRLRAAPVPAADWQYDALFAKPAFLV